MTYKGRLLILAGAGLFLRLVIMPFTMHGQDLLFINYFPMMWAKEGIWDVYGYIHTHFSHFPATYYGPVSFVIMAVPNFIYVKILCISSLVKMLEASSAMMGGSLTTLDYARVFFGPELFKNLFLMKAPYLVFDFWIGFILLKLAVSQKHALISYAAWMLNIVVLHTTYAIGQADIITAFFIIYALYAAIKGRPYLSVALLSLGGATKLYPYLLIPPACFLLGRAWKGRAGLFFAGALVSVLLYLPFYWSSGSAFLEYFISSKRVGYGSGIKWIMTGIFLFFYCLLLKRSLKDSAGEAPEKKLVYYLTVVLFLSYACFSIRFRYLLYIMPLLALLIPRHKKFWLLILLIVLIEAFIGLTTRYAQFGLFAPVSPEYFLGLPAVQELAGRFVNITAVYKIMFRVLLLIIFVSAWRVWRCLINRVSI